MDFYNQIIDLGDRFDFLSKELYELNKSKLKDSFTQKVKSLRSFDQKNKFVDNKIEFDQRFFNDSYAEFQLMISDIRKQIRINEEIISMKNRLEHKMEKI